MRWSSSGRSPARAAEWTTSTRRRRRMRAHTVLGRRSSCCSRACTACSRWERHSDSTLVGTGANTQSAKILALMLSSTATRGRCSQSGVSLHVLVRSHDLHVSNLPCPLCCCPHRPLKATRGTAASARLSRNGPTNRMYSVTCGFYGNAAEVKLPRRSCTVP